MITDIETTLIEKFGKDALEDAIKRLCKPCYRNDVGWSSVDWRDVGCYLFPITTDGKDCPYYQNKDSEISNKKEKEMKKQWRPEGWGTRGIFNDAVSKLGHNPDIFEAIEAGADAILESLKNHSKDMPAYVRFIEEPNGTWCFIPNEGGEQWE